MEQRPLQYGSGSAQITREGDGFVAVFPPPESEGAFRVGATVTGFMFVLCLVGSFWPAGVMRVGGGVVRHPGGVAARVVSIGLAAGAAASFWYALRRRSICPTVELRGGTLTYREPGLWGVREHRYDLARYVDVDVLEDSDGEDVYLSLRRGGGGASGDRAPDPPPEIARRSSSPGAKSDLEMVADALRHAVWPGRAAARRRPSTFTRVGPDTIESDKGFVVRLPAPGRVEYAEGGNTMSLCVERGWSEDHAMCFVLRREALNRWDGVPPGVTLAADTQREILHNLGEALREWDVRVVVGGGTGRAE